MTRDLLERRLEAARARDPLLQRFGAAAHSYRLRDRMSDQRLEELEALAGIQLPAAYRRHLLDCGDGGAGPGHGLLPFDHPEQQAQLCSRFVPSSPLDRFQEEESVARAQQLEGFADAPGGTDRPLPDGKETEGPRTKAAKRPADASPSRSLQTETGPGPVQMEAPPAPSVELRLLASGTRLDWPDGRLPGVVALADDGCALASLLVVGGPLDGRVLLDRRAVGGGLVLLDDFDAWYGRWLDELESDSPGASVDEELGCPLPEALDGYLREVERDRGVEPGGLSEAELAEALGAISDEGLSTHADGSDGDWLYDPGQVTRLCRACQALVERLEERGLLRRAQVAEGRATRLES